jgi:hypothetical protein
VQVKNVISAEEQQPAASWLDKQTGKNTVKHAVAKNK